MRLGTRKAATAVELSKPCGELSSIHDLAERSQITQFGGLRLLQRFVLPITG